MNAHVLQIVIFRDGNPVGSEVFLPGEYTVGSHYGCELVLPDPKVAPAHARLSFRGGRIRLSDLGKVPAGTRVNGRLMGNGEVSSRDDVAVGPFLLKFRVMGGQSTANGEEGAGIAPPAQAAGAPHRPPIPRQPPPIPRQPTPVPVAPADLFRPSPHAPPIELGPEQTAARPAAAMPPVMAPTPAPSSEDGLRTAAVREPLPPLRASPSRPTSPLDDVRAMPSLRVRVFWGHAMVGIHGFSFGRKVVAEAQEKADLPVYGLALPEKRFSFAYVDQGRWTVRVPPGLTAYRYEKSDWKPVIGASDGNSEAPLIPMDPGEVVQMGDARHSIEVRVDRVPAVPRKSIREMVDRQFGIPLSIFSVLGLAAMIAMPYFKQEQADFTPRHIAPVRALLKPPEKKKTEEKPEEKKEKKEKKEEKAPPDPAKKAVAKTKAIKAVEKTAVAVKAVESLLKATSKLAGGPKGYGDKGMGFKVSPLIGKPPIVQAGLGFGAGMGGFGAETKGIGSMRGMGGGGGIGSFATGTVGKGKVAGAVISANVRKAEIRGQLDRELIAKVINEHMGEIRGCYERALLKEAGLAGKLVLEWTIETSGIVSEIRVKTATLRGPDVPNCIIGGLKGWTFPKPKGGNVVVSYPFLFNSVGF